MPKSNSIRVLQVALICASPSIAGYAFAGDISLGDYLNQVRGQNRQAVSLTQKADNAPLSARQADLLYSPKLDAEATAIRDGKRPQTPGVSYRRMDINKGSVGVSQQFEFGLQSKLKYEVQSTEAVDMVVNGAPIGKYAEVQATPSLEMSYPILQNGGGKQAAETAKVLRAQSEVENYSAKAALDGIMLEAEMRYWNLAVRQAVTRIQQKYSEKTSALVDYVRKRVNSNLGDESELFQINAAYEAGQLELESAKQDEQIAWQEFNASREDNAVDQGPVALESVDISSLAFPAAKPGPRNSTQAAAAANKLNQANNSLSADKLRPTLDAFATVALNNPEEKANDALSNSFESDRPTTAIGIKFSMPLGVSAVDDVRHSALENAKISQLDYEAKLAQEDRDFTLLSQRIASAKKKYTLSNAILVAQRKKLENETKRLKIGRTTLFQVLQFEQDLLRSQLGTVRAAAEVLTLNGQIKLFVNSSTSN